MRRLATACFAATCLLLAAGGWLLIANQTVSIGASDVGSDDPAGEVTCSIAPYDAGLNGNDAPPGGEHSQQYSEEVASECYAVNMVRLNAAVGCLLLAPVLLAGGVVSIASSRSNSRAPVRSPSADR